MVTGGGGDTATRLEVSLQPFASVMVTRYPPGAVTVILCVVAELLHIYATAVVDVRVKLPPVTRNNGPAGVTIGGTAILIVTTTTFVANS